MAEVGVRSGVPLVSGSGLYRPTKGPVWSVVGMTVPQTIPPIVNHCPGPLPCASAVIVTSPEHD